MSANDFDLEVQGGFIENACGVQARSSVSEPLSRHSRASIGRTRKVKSGDGVGDGVGQSIAAFVWRVHGTITQAFKSVTPPPPPQAAAGPHEAHCSFAYSCCDHAIFFFFKHLTATAYLLLFASIQTRCMSQIIARSLGLFI